MSTTLDIHLQRMAQEAVAEGLRVIDKQLPKRKQGQVQVAMIAADPRTGEVLSLVGGRGYSRRNTTARSPLVVNRARSSSRSSISRRSKRWRRPAAAI